VMIWISESGTRGGDTRDAKFWAMTPHVAA
jgi:hypothetical protein